MMIFHEAPSPAEAFTMTGSYDTIWIIDIVLAIGVSLIHMPIKEAHVALKIQAT